MKKVLFSIAFILCPLLLVGCSAETMVLLDEELSEVNISKSKGFGEMNEDVFLTFNDKKSLETFEKAITTAVKKTGKLDVSNPEFDIMVKYTSEKGALPTHALHLWLGMENEKSIFTYMMDESSYYTSPEMTNKLRKLILSDENS
ncbi:hypothetical protein KHA96_16560 [Bacillus sp. FJAT-49711]|uniref:hypothetical protein n=1 Tax=Bacillus sp. FJAT-49711 TaxID=2833585 RepID=UPI001BC9CFE0|nr:hypothetical protein [Bacillus sp. FJAT-49711]MBS4219926.1 hypothetical protein [Bacillus sp. FJAT-49711]